MKSYKQVGKKISKKVLVTGIDGFTGGHVRTELRRLDYDVYGVSSWLKNGSGQDSGIDITDAKEVTKYVRHLEPAIVIHLAGVSSVNHENVGELYQTNVLGTRNLLSALSGLKHPPKAVVLASSAQVYGNNTMGLIDEETKPSPNSDYSLSKYTMELLAQGLFSSLPITIVRPFNYTGAGQSSKFLIPKIVDHFRRGASEIKLGNIDVYRDFSDVRVIAWAYAQLAAKPVPGEVFNFSSGKSVSIAEVLGILTELTGHNMQVHVDESLMRKNEVFRLEGNSSKLWRIIGQPPKISLRETLAWMLENP